MLVEERRDYGYVNRRKLLPAISSESWPSPHLFHSICPPRRTKVAARRAERRPLQAMRKSANQPYLTMRSFVRIPRGKEGLDRIFLFQARRSKGQAECRHAEKGKMGKTRTSGTTDFADRIRSHPSAIGGRRPLRASSRGALARRSGVRPSTSRRHPPGRGSDAHLCGSHPAQANAEAVAHVPQAPSRRR